MEASASSSDSNQGDGGGEGATPENKGTGLDLVSNNRDDLAHPAPLQWPFPKPSVGLLVHRLLIRPLSGHHIKAHYLSISHLFPPITGTDHPQPSPLNHYLPHRFRDLDPCPRHRQLPLQRHRPFHRHLRPFVPSRFHPRLLRWWPRGVLRDDTIQPSRCTTSHTLSRAVMTSTKSN